MDFLHKNANNQPHAPRGEHGGAPMFNQIGGAGKMKQLMGDEPNWLRITSVVLLFSLTILAVAIALLMYFGKSNEGDSITKDKYQAVFLSNGQVYFGKVNALNNQYVDLRDIYYLNSQSQSADGTTEGEKDTNSTFSLVKLGCELHGPADQMIINREQVTFWENLKSDGKVAKAIGEWQKQNPDGQNCEQNSTGTQQQSTGNNNAQNAAGGTPAANTTD
jgi:hypothetical protein